MHSFEVHSHESACRKSGRLGLVQLLVKVGDLGARSGIWDGRLGARFNRNDESSVRECCVQGGGVSELQ